MQWLNEPASWQRTGDVLRVSVDPGTDFWRTTGYGYVHDNGHVYGEPLPGDLDVSVRVRGAFANQYDQAGIMLRADEDTWLKTGLEFFEGRPRLSTVLTMGCSSWMVADLPPGTDEVTPAGVAAGRRGGGPLRGRGRRRRARRAGVHAARPGDARRDRVRRAGRQRVQRGLP